MNLNAWKETLGGCVVGRQSKVTTVCLQYETWLLCQLNAAVVKEEPRHSEHQLDAESGSDIGSK